MTARGCGNELGCRRRRAARRGLALAATALSLGLAGRARGDAGASVVVNEGLTVSIHAAVEIEDRWLVREGGRVWFRHPVAGEVELLTGPDDPRLPRAHVTAFEPLQSEPVANALLAMTGIDPRLSVDVFLLPAPPVAALGSFARRSAILLSPGFGPVPEETVAALVTHELGHVLSWAYLDEQPGRWDAYCAVRGLSLEEGGAEAPHAQRVREILAEDVRCLFGGALARGDGTVENHDLASPDQVVGLAQLLASYFVGAPGVPGGSARARAFPLPAPRDVTIEVQPAAVGESAAAADAESAAAARLAVFDVRGRLVRCLDGGALDNGRLLLRWDGRDESGQRLAAGRYLFLVRWGTAQARGSLTLVH